MEIQDHPAAMLFPMMSEEELGKLADDIARNGLLEAITIYEEKILDGRNRYRACLLAGVEPKFRAVNGNLTSAVEYVLSENLQRRHLTISQRAAVAAEMIPLLAEEAKKRQGSRNDLHNNKLTSGPIGPEVKGVQASAEIAGRALAVSANSVKRAIRAKRDHPELHEKVKRGELSVTAAAEGKAVVTRQPKVVPRDYEGQRRDKDAEWNTDSQRKLEFAKSQSKKMWSGLGQVSGVCKWLLKIDRGMVKSVSGSEEIKSAIRECREAASILKKFAKAMEAK